MCNATSSLTSCNLRAVQTSGMGKKRWERWWHPWSICQRGCGSNPILFLCVWCPSSSISIPIPSCLRPHSQWVTSGDHAGGIPASLAAEDAGCHLLSHPHCWDGHHHQVHAKTAVLTTECWGKLPLSLCQHCGGLKCIQQAIGTLSRAQTMAFPLGS